MLSEQLIEEVILDQRNYLIKKDRGIDREIDFERIISSKQIVVITGIRRSGKSTLLRQIAARFKNFNYINFDDERLFNFDLSDFQRLMHLFKKESDSNIFLLDEIQNVAGWERFIRRIHDEGNKIFITGSNAKLLSSELATHLTGRYLKIELYPFSFREFLTFSKINDKKRTSDNKAIILKAFDKYLAGGGFPDYITCNDIHYLQNIYEDIIFKDLIARFGIRNSKTFKTLAHYLFTNFTKEIRYNSLKDILQIKNVNTIKDYIDYLQQSYLIFECYKYDFSLKKQIIYNKKVYCIDNGLRKSISFSFSTNLGHYLENLIYLELRRRNAEVFFYKTAQNYEVDFLVKEKKIFIMQVCYSLDDAKTVAREKRALIEAMKELKLKTSTIISYNQYDLFKEDGFQIEIIPAWNWLLNN